MVRILDHLRRKYKYGYPEKVEYCLFDPNYITLSAVVPNNGEGNKYFRIVLKAENFITGYNPVEGFVSHVSPSRSNKGKEVCRETPS